MRNNRFKNQNADSNLKTLSLSVVIPTHLSLENISFLVSRLLTELKTLPLVEREILIICDQVKPKHLRIPSLLKERMIKIIFSGKRKGASAARNIGIKEAKGEILLFIDSDCLPYPNLIKSHLTMYLCSNFNAVAGPIIFRSDGSLLSKALEHSSFLVPFKRPLEDKIIPWSPTANLSVKKKVAQKILFDESFPPGGGSEDIYFGLQLQNKGYGSILSAPEAKVSHDFWKGWGNVLKRFFRWGWGEGLLVSKIKKQTKAFFKPMVFTIYPLFLLELSIPFIIFIFTGKILGVLFFIFPFHCFFSSLIEGCLIFSHKKGELIDFGRYVFLNIPDRLFLLSYDAGRYISCLKRKMIPQRLQERLTKRNIAYAYTYGYGVTRINNSLIRILLLLK